MMNEAITGSRQLTHAERREFVRLAHRVGKIVASDQKFFERFPHRRYRVRLAGRAEIEHARLATGIEIKKPLPGFAHYTVVTNIKDGVRLRFFIVGREGCDSDMSESQARGLIEKVFGASDITEIAASFGGYGT